MTVYLIYRTEYFAKESTDSEKVVQYVCVNPNAKDSVEVSTNPEYLFARVAPLIRD